MGRTRTVFLLMAVLVLGMVEEARACSSFFLTRQEGMVLGKNLDWNFGDGLVLVNKRGMTKTAAVMDDQPALTWTSRFGSVSFNQYGRDFAHAPAFTQTDFLQYLTPEAIDYVAAYPERFTYCQ